MRDIDVLGCLGAALPSDAEHRPQGLERACADEDAAETAIIAEAAGWVVATVPVGKLRQLLPVSPEKAMTAQPASASPDEHPENPR